MEKEEKIEVFAKIVRGTTVCICKRYNRCRGSYCDRTVVTRDRYEGWRDIMERDRYGKSRDEYS